MEMGISIIFLFAGVGFIAGALLLFRRSYRRCSRWVTVAGTVIEYYERDNNGRRFFHPKVRFTAESGKEFDFVSIIGSNRKPYRIGAGVKVLYSPTDPENADIKLFMNLWFVPCILLIFASVFSGIAIYILKSAPG